MTITKQKITKTSPRKKKKEPAFVIDAPNPKGLKTLGIIALASILFFGLVCRYAYLDNVQTIPPVTVTEAAPVPSVEPSPAIEPITPTTPVALPTKEEKLFADIDDVEDLKIWQLVRSLQYKFPKTIAKEVAKELNVRYYTKIKDLNDEQKKQLIPSILKAGKQFKK